jgi:large subunit ribosomal protein L25
MAEIILAAEVGRPLGSSHTRRLRAQGKIPGVVYGHGADPVPVAVAARDLRIALAGESGSNTLLSLQTANETFLTLARDIQRHPVRNTVTHVDFLIVARDQIIAAEVPVTLVGEALEVQHGDGLVEQQLFSLPVNARPADIPAVVEVDISSLTIGGSVRVSDLSLPDGVSTDLDPDAAIVVGQPPRVQAVAGEEAEAEAGEGAAAGAVAEGAAAASESSGGEG